MILLCDMIEKHIITDDIMLNCVYIGEQTFTYDVTYSGQGIFSCTYECTVKSN